jgi:cell division protein FtsB
MKRDVNELKQKLEDVDIQLHDSQSRCNHLAEDNEKLLEQLRLQRQELEAEKLTNAQLAEQLNFESSRRLPFRTESFVTTSEVRFLDLEEQIRSLKLENEKLKHENEELREHAVAVGVNEGRRLMASSDTPSYAAELEVLSKDELVIMNQRLRDYIDTLLLQILSNDPNILEKP